MNGPPLLCVYGVSSSTQQDCDSFKNDDVLKWCMTCACSSIIDGVTNDNHCACIKHIALVD